MYSSAEQSTCSIHNYSYRLPTTYSSQFLLGSLESCWRDSGLLVMLSTTWKGLELAKKGWGREAPTADSDSAQDRGLFEITREAVILLSSLYIPWRVSKFGPECAAGTDCFGGTSLWLPLLPFLEAFCPCGPRVSPFCWHPQDSHPGLPFLTWRLQLSNLLWDLPPSKLTWPTVGYSSQVQLKCSVV